MVGPVEGRAADRLLVAGEHGQHAVDVHVQLLALDDQLLDRLGRNGLADLHRAGQVGVVSALTVFEFPALVPGGETKEMFCLTLYLPKPV